MSEMLTLGIETSCDETAASVIRDEKTILSNIVSSSLHLHKKFGGVVPEIACRAHVELISWVVDRALTQAKVNLKGINLIAVTQGPGLVGALLVGISMAKAVSLVQGIPLIGVNHLRAHIYASFMGNHSLKFPFIGLVVSGGHTVLVYIKDWNTWELLGQTKDDAAGEAFDKVAKILGLGYPGGPIIDRLSKEIGKNRIEFPRAHLGNSLDFSFSGIKTAVLYYVRDKVKDRGERRVASRENKNKKPNVKDQNNKALSVTEIAHITAGFQEAVVDMLVKNVLSACRLKKNKRVVIGGGVSRNSALRNRLLKESLKEKIEVYLPDIKLCVDNAAMVAGLGYKLFTQGAVSSLDMTAVPNWGI